MTCKYCGSSNVKGNSDPDLAKNGWLECGDCGSEWK